jgi:very-short-patch-repair endonuclease
MISSLEKKFGIYWAAAHGCPLDREVKLVPGRKFRCDFFEWRSNVVIELEGGHWVSGRHTRGKGFQDDCEKYLLITLEGYTIFRLTDKQITVPIIESIVEFIERKAKL